MAAGLCQDFDTALFGLADHFNRLFGGKVVKIYRNIQQFGKCKDTVHRFCLTCIGLGFIKELPVLLAFIQKILFHEIGDGIALSVKTTQGAFLLCGFHDFEDVGVVYHDTGVDGKHLECGYTVLHQFFNGSLQVFPAVPCVNEFGMHTVIQYRISHFCFPFLHCL